MPAAISLPWLAKPKHKYEIKVDANGGPPYIFGEESVEVWPGMGNIKLYNRRLTDAEVKGLI